MTSAGPVVLECRSLWTQKARRDSHQFPADAAMGRVPADGRFLLWASLCLLVGALGVLPYLVLPSETVTAHTTSPTLSATYDQNQRYRLQVTTRQVLRPFLSTAYDMVSNSSWSEHRLPAHMSGANAAKPLRCSVPQQRSSLPYPLEERGNVNRPALAR